MGNHTVRKVIIENEVVIIHNGASSEVGGLSFFFFKGQRSCRCVLFPRKRGGRLDLEM